jgi:hypothetical protein
LIVYAAFIRAQSTETFGEEATVESVLSLGEVAMSVIGEIKRVVGNLECGLLNVLERSDLDLACLDRLASFSNTSCDFAKDSAQRCSEANSSNKMAATELIC